jgi:hypothetical protein
VIRRILVVKRSSFGDVVHALPAVTYLRQAAPSAETAAERLLAECRASIRPAVVAAAMAELIRPG